MLVQIRPAIFGVRQEVLGMLLEHGDDRRLAVRQPRGDELGRQRALARASRAGDQDRVPGRDAAAEHFVQSATPVDSALVGSLAIGIVDCAA